jgi:hypothetical protein
MARPERKTENNFLTYLVRSRIIRSLHVSRPLFSPILVYLIERDGKIPQIHSLKQSLNGVHSSSLRVMQDEMITI